MKYEIIQVTEYESGIDGYLSIGHKDEPKIEVIYNQKHAHIKTLHKALEVAFKLCDALNANQGVHVNFDMDIENKGTYLKTNKNF